MTLPLNICYISQVLTLLETLRYSKSICALTELQVLARKKTVDY